MWFVDSVIFHLSGTNGFGTWGENVKRNKVFHAKIDYKRKIFSINGPKSIVDKLLLYVSAHAFRRAWPYFCVLYRN
ncbi:hypothetical protein SporoS204_11485 [Sporosarcina ureae]|uniref:Uncharacterized protein n=1 Tax=Sporosarcina ureae TaxID=1571 RepID=A0ABN4YS73_SPOUR|nr:hypothetical protein SporoS204_11485 [Sporosarcina ureae]